MSKIKSALELALERTANVEIDRDAIRKDEAVMKGKQLAGRFLNEKDVSINAELTKVDGEEGSWIREGFLEILFANLILPRYESDLNSLPRIIEGLKALIKSKNTIKSLDHMMGQYSELLKQYLDNCQKLSEQLSIQWEARLQQKEQQLKQQTGQTIKLSPEQDPEFNKVLSEQLAHMDAQYNDALAKGKTEIRRLF